MATNLAALSLAALTETASYDTQTLPNTSATISEITAMGFSGPQIIKGFRSNPIIEVAGHIVDFSSNTWDFSNSDDAGSAAGNKRILFKEGSRCDQLKLFCLLGIIMRNGRSSGTIVKTRLIQNAVNRIEQDSAVALHIGPKLAKSYFESRVHIGYPTLVKEKRALAEFLTFADAYFGEETPQSTFTYLRNADKQLLDAHLEAGKHQEIPLDYLDVLIDVAQKSMLNETCSSLVRITAAAMLIVSQIGMRISELLGVRTDALKISNPSFDGATPIAYLEFLVPKSSREGGGKRIARCIANEISLQAYRFLLDYCADKREKLKTDALIVYPQQKRKFNSGTSFYEGFDLLLLENRDKIPCLNTQDDYPTLSSASLDARFKDRLTAKFLRRHPDIDPGNDVFVYPTPHQFRVTVCTALYEQGVDLRFIKQHMSHLTEDMAAYYIRSDKEIEYKCSLEVYECVFNDGSKLLGKHGDEFVERVKAFIENNRERVVADNIAIAELAAKEFPLRKKIGGVCIRCGQIVPCQENKQTDELLCAFNLCPNHCHMYFAASDTYETVNNMAQIAEINAKRGHSKAAANEIRKMQNIIRDSLLPELEQLEVELTKQGRDRILNKFPYLTSLVDSLNTVKEEVEEWLTK